VVIFIDNSRNLIDTGSVPGTTSPRWVPSFDEPLGEKVAGVFEIFLDLPVEQWIYSSEQQTGPRAS
jgi:hypothetical protein